MPDRSLLTEYGAAELLNITPHQVRRLAREGRIPLVELLNGVVRFDARELLTFITMRTRPAVDELTTRPAIEELTTR